MRICYNDFETGGLDPLKGAEPVELAAIMLDENLQEVSRFGPRLMRVEEPKNLNPGALKVNNKTVEEIMNGEDPAIVFVEYLSWLKKHNNGKRAIFAAHNADFDISFMRIALDKYICRGAYDKVYQTKKMCTMDLANFVMTFSQKVISNAKLGTITEYYNISHEAHTAMGDVEAGVEVLRRLTGEIKGSVLPP
jgi:DNA polymerase III epsilon subunit-like protein